MTAVGRGFCSQPQSARKAREKQGLVGDSRAAVDAPWQMPGCTSALLGRRVRMLGTAAAAACRPW